MQLEFATEAQAAEIFANMMDLAGSKGGIVKTCKCGKLEGRTYCGSCIPQYPAKTQAETQAIQDAKIARQARKICMICESPASYKFRGQSYCIDCYIAE